VRNDPGAAFVQPGYHAGLPRRGWVRVIRVEAGHDTRSEVGLPVWQLVDERLPGQCAAARVPFAQPGGQTPLPAFAFFILCLIFVHCFGPITELEALKLFKNEV